MVKHKSVSNSDQHKAEMIKLRRTHTYKRQLQYDNNNYYHEITVIVIASTYYIILYYYCMEDR